MANLTSGVQWAETAVMHYALCTMNYALRTMHYALYSMRHAPFTVHYALWTLHDESCSVVTVNFSLCTVGQYAFCTMHYLITQF